MKYLAIVFPLLVFVIPQAFGAPLYDYEEREYDFENYFANLNHPGLPNSSIYNKENKNPERIVEEVILDELGTNSDYAARFVVTFSEGNLVDDVTFQTFTRLDLHPTLDREEIVFEPGVDLNVLLESIPTKEKKNYYKLLQKIQTDISQARFNMRIDMITEDGTVVYSIAYRSCELVNYSMTARNNLFVDRDFEPTLEHGKVLCSGVKFYSNANAPVQKHENLLTADDLESLAKEFATNFDVTIKYANEEVVKRNFSEFRSYQFGDPNSFFLKGILNTEDKKYYQMIGDYTRFDFLPAVIDFDISVRTSDGTVLQKWSYTNCKPTDSDILIKENHDIETGTIFGCIGTTFSVPDSSDGFIENYFPDPGIFADSYRVKFHGGELDRYYSFAHLLSIEPIVDHEFFANDLPDVPEHRGFWITNYANLHVSELYNYISRHINPGQGPAPIDADIEVHSKNGKLVLRGLFKSCSPAAYDPHWVLTEDGPRMIDRTAFLCDSMTIGI